MSKITHILEKYSLQINISVSLIFFLIYSFMIPASPVSLHYSDMFITLGKQAGLVQSPGYPFFIVLIWFMTNTIGNIIGIAYSANLLASIFAFVTIFFVFKTLLVIGSYAQLNYRNSKISPTTLTYSLAILLTLILGSSHLFWREAIYLERYMFSAMLIALATYYLIQLLISKNNLLTNFILGIIIGIGISHQWIFFIYLFVAGSFIYQKYKNTKIKSWISLLIGIIIPVIVAILLLIFYGSNSIPYSSQLSTDVASIKSFINQNYIGDGYSISSNPIEILSSIQVDSLIVNGFQLIKELIASVGWFTVVILLFGLLYVPQKTKSWFPILLITLLTSLITSLTVLFNWQENITSYPEIVPNILILHPLIILLMWFGAYEISSRVLAAVDVLNSDRRIKSALFILPMIILCLFAYSRYKKVSLTGKLFRYQTSKSMLTQVGDNALVACFSYESCYSLIYTQQIEQFNPQARIVPFYYKPGNINFPHTDLQHFNYTEFPLVMWDILTWNRYTHQIYSTDMFEGYFNLFSIDLGFFNYVPLGYYSQLTNGTPKKLPKTDISLSRQMLDTTVASWDKSLQKTKLSLVKRHMFNSSIYLKYGQRDRGVDEANIATTLGYDLPDEASSEIASLRSDVESILPSDFYKLDTELITTDIIKTDLNKYIDLGNLPQALHLAQGILTIDPTDIDTRITYASLLERTEASAAAVLEYKNVLVLEPDNQIATERLDYQKTLGITD